jgi:hypothetical protein
MAGRSRPSFTKRLKERARQEKQREKAERKQQRKMQKVAGEPQSPGDDAFIHEAGLGGSPEPPQDVVGAGPAGVPKGDL